ncbi:MAG: hypothetical protein D6816_13665 [Bacteroidetes bacterium]|nr:MAG: hypothetical protein D6816_13665 [Bacteroidota bacterium]
MIDVRRKPANQSLGKRVAIVHCIRGVAIAFNGFVVSLLLFLPPAYAGGSFSVTDAEFVSVIEQVPNLWNSIRDSFDLSQLGVASMIGSKVNKHLGHRRVGPYCLTGKPKGQIRNKFSFCFNTEVLWLDEKGHNSNLGAAFDIKEKFLSLEISPLRK